MGFGPDEGRMTPWTPWRAIERRKVNWIVDADIRKFFDTLDRGWLMRFLEHRIGTDGC